MTGLGSLSLGLFGGLTSSSPRIQSLDLSVLGQASAPVQAQGPPDPRRLTPWDSNVTKPDTDRLAREALNSRFLVQTSLGNGPGSAVRSGNDRQLFVLHNALSRLSALAEKMTSNGLSAIEQRRYEERIDRGLAEIQQYARSVKLEDAVLLGGRRLNDHRSEPLSRPSGRYQTPPLATGATDTVPDAFLGERRFSIAITRLGETSTVTVDLAAMGTTPRTLTNVASFINQTLSDAGFETRVTKVETKVPATVKDGPEGIEQRFEVRLATGERARFGSLAAREPALSVAGVTVAADGRRSSAVTRLVGLEPVGSGDGGVTQPFTRAATARDGDIVVRSMVHDADGNTFVVADLTGPLDGLQPKAGQDAILRKIDSNGAVVWTRPLGAGASASGTSVALAPDGRIAIAGHVDGKLENSTAVTGDGRDAYVAVFDSEGRDLWFHQKGASRNDSASSVAFAADGTLYLAGTSTESYGGAESRGGTDAWVQAFDATGVVSWTQSFGGAGDDTPAGLVATATGPVLVWNQPDGARMASLDPLSGAVTGGIRDLSQDGLARVSLVTGDGTGGIALAGGGSGTAVDQVRVIDLASGTVSASLTSAGETIRALSVSNGQVALALGAGTNPTTGETDLARTLVRGFDLATGTQTFSRSLVMDSRQPISLDLDPVQDETLAALGLPAGDLTFGDTESLTDRTGLRPGDSFSIVVNGNRERKIDIVQGDTLRTLATRINRVLLNDGRAEVTLASGASTLKITPARGDRIELRAGRGVTDALAQLGLGTGVAMDRPRAAGAARSVSDPPPVVALELPDSADTSSKDKAKSFQSAIDGALRRIRIGYREISNDPTMVELRKQTAGGPRQSLSASASAYYQKQISSGQDALRRLGVSA
ncbi:MAG: hypothetical protein MUF14_06020 [Hyphomonadaceae bacterium]|nr:hypothetical protein [Hyphomonadaceae bacterium]